MPNKEKTNQAKPSNNNKLTLFITFYTPLVEKETRYRNSYKHMLIGLQQIKTEHA